MEISKLLSSVIIEFHIRNVLYKMLEYRGCTNKLKRKFTLFLEHIEVPDETPNVFWYPVYKTKAVKGFSTKKAIIS